MIKKLARSIREYKKESVLTPLFMVGEVRLECVIPLVTARLINAIQGAAGGSLDMAVIGKYAVILVLMALGSMTCGILSGWFCATASSGFARNLLHDLFAKVRNFSFANIDSFSSSGLVTRLTTDVTNVQNAFMKIIRIAVRAPLMFGFAISMSVYGGRALSLVFVIILPILAFGLFAFLRRAMPMLRAVFK